MMFSAFQTFGKLGAMASSVARAWSPLALWPDGVDSPGMWIDPSLLTASFNDYTGTTPVATPGTVADSANPVGLALDIRAGATALADPGNHMLQATSAARPLESARVNLLTYTEDFSDAAWSSGGGGTSVNSDKYTAPDGSLTADELVADGSNASRSQSVVLSASQYTLTFSVRSGTSTTFRFGLNNGGWLTASSSIVSGSGSVSGTGLMTVTGLDSNWTVISLTATATAVSTGFYIYPGPSSQSAGDSIGIWGAQLNLGSTAIPYQRVNTASDYTATGITPFQLYDGVDDGMATASFAAGTLVNGMDCMIPVRRDSAANCVAGLYNGVADATKFFGMAESASGSGCVGSGAGTPTVWVDNTQLTGGTAVTRGTLHTALTAGSYHILEFRNLDLSAWTATGFGLYTSYVFPGARGDIMLFESTASTADKDAARQYLADKYGVTLP
jgi:hypothetical protein